MILRLSLEHAKEKNRQQTLDIWGVDANDVAKITQHYGTPKTRQKALEAFVGVVIDAKLSTKYYNFKVVDWEFVDHSHPQTQKPL